MVQAQEIVYQVREILNSTSKSVKSEEISLWVATRFGKGFSRWQR